VRLSSLVYTNSGRAAVCCSRCLASFTFFPKHLILMLCQVSNVTVAKMTARLFEQCFNAIKHMSPALEPASPTVKRSEAGFIELTIPRELCTQYYSRPDNCKLLRRGKLRLWYKPQSIRNGGPIVATKEFWIVGTNLRYPSNLKLSPD
jgi:hypothetical protein